MEMLYISTENMQNARNMQKYAEYLKDDNYIFLGSTSVVVFLRTRICINI